MEYQYNDGGRAAAGYKGQSGDCVTRAIAIATQRPYQEVYNAINQEAKFEHKKRGKSSARNGVRKTTYRKYLAKLGWKWTPTMSIGSGCTVHLKADELPDGRIIACLSKHLVAIIDGVINDTYDPSRNESRCVYGYFAL